MERTFFSLDKNQDGLLSPQEIYNGLYTALGAWTEWSEEYQETMSKLDTNGDGKIDYSEFITAAVNRAQILSKQNLDTTFKIFDSDGNGMISVQELKDVFSGGTLLNTNFEETESVWQKIMQEVDTDSDGNISYDEFYK